MSKQIRFQSHSGYKDVLKDDESESGCDVTVGFIFLKSSFQQLKCDRSLHNSR